MTITISADTVAWYGAVVATIALIVELARTWRDRARLGVEATFGWRIHGSGHPYKTDVDYIALRVINYGRRPRTIEKVGFTYRQPERSQHVIASDCFFKGPQEVTEGRSREWLVAQGDLKPEDIEEVWAYDQTGTKFTGKAKQL